MRVIQRCFAVATLLGALCVAAMAEAGGGDVPEPLRLIADVRPFIAKAAQLGEASGAPAKFKAARKAMLEYTRREGASGRLERVSWRLPFGTCYVWCLRYELRTHAEAQAAVREALDVLRNVSEENAAIAACAASRLAMLYAEQWMDLNAIECIRLADETEEWVLNRPGGKKEWITAFRYTQAGFLFQERQFKEQEREWLWSSRQERLRAYVEGEEMGLDMRTRVLTHWAQTLYYAGRGEEALALMRDWDERHGAESHSAEYLKWAMRLALFEKGDWSAASRVLAHANKLKQEWQRKPSEQRAYEALAEMYFENIGLTDYQLLRARGIEKKTPVGRRDSLLSMGGGMN